MYRGALGVNTEVRGRYRLDRYSFALICNSVLTDGEKLLKKRLLVP